MLTRRGLLGLMVAAAADAERLLWRPKRYVRGIERRRPTGGLFDPFEDLAAQYRAGCLGKTDALLASLRIGDLLTFQGLAGPEQRYVVTGVYEHRELPVSTQLPCVLSGRRIAIYGGESTRRRFRLG